MGKYHYIGLGILLVVTFLMVNSEYVFAVLSAEIPVSTTGRVVDDGFGFNDQLDTPTGTVASSGNLYMAYMQRTDPFVISVSANHELIFQKSVGATVGLPVLLDTTTGNKALKWIDIATFVDGTTVDVLATKIICFDPDPPCSVGNSPLADLLHFRSTDDGVSFGSGNLITGAVNAIVTTDSTGRWYDVDGNNISVFYDDTTAGSGNGLVFKKSSNGGTTFGSLIIIDPDDGTVAEAGSQKKLVMEQSTDGTKIWLIYTGTNPVTGFPDTDIFYSRSIDSGATFSTPIIVTGAGIDGLTGGWSYIKVNGNDVTLFFTSRTGGGLETFSQVRSSNSGLSFSAQEDIFLGTTCDWDLIGSRDQHITQAGSAIYTMCLGISDPITFNDVDVFVAKSSDMGATWGSLVSVTDDPLDLSSGNVMIEAVGNNVYVTWVGEDDQLPFKEYNAFVSSNNAGATFSSEQQINVTPLFPQSNPHIRGIGNDMWFGLKNFTSKDVVFRFETFVAPTDFTLYKNSGGVTCFDAFDFSCPLNLSGKTSTNTFPTRIAGVGTDNGYFSVWQQNVSSTDLRLFYASTTDGITGTTPLDISGSVFIPTVGIDENRMFIFEDSGTIDIFWKEISGSLADQSTSEINHARSTNGGISFTSTLVNSDIDFFFPTVDGNTIGLAMHDAGQDRMIFRSSTNGGTTFGSNIFIDGDADECNVPAFPVRMLKDGSTIHVSWYGTFAGNSTTAVCYNQSVDSGATWSSTVQILSNTIIDQGASPDTFQPQPKELSIFADAFDRVLVVWQNIADDAFMQARSTNSGVSFGSAQLALKTNGFDFDGNDDTACTDPFPVGEVFGNESDGIFIVCTGNGVFMKISLDLGASYQFSLTEISQPTGISYQGRAFSDGLVSVASGRTGFTDLYVFANAIGGFPLTFTNATMFMTEDLFNVNTGNQTHAWLGFEHLQDGVANAWVSVFPTGIVIPPAPPDTPPVITILGDNPVQHLINTTYTDAGATCTDAEDGSITSIPTVENVNTIVLGTGTVTYSCTDSDANTVQEIRTVNVVEQITTTVTTGGAVGAPVSGTVDTGIEGLTPEQILAFDQAVADAIASIEPSEGNIIETIIQTFFEFIVVDKVHEELQLQSFLDDQRLGFRWSTGDDLIIVSATPALSPFMFTFEQFPVVRQGSGAFVSTNFILYNLEVPRTECTVTISVNCVEKIRYEIPVTVNAIINGTQVSDTGTITVDLTEDEIDPILLIILSTAVIPFIAVIIQRSRGRSSIEPLRRVIS